MIAVSCNSRRDPFVPPQSVTGRLGAPYGRPAGVDPRIRPHVAEGDRLGPHCGLLATADEIGSAAAQWSSRPHRIARIGLKMFGGGFVDFMTSEGLTHNVVAYVLWRRRRHH
jgi:hypothetical protein